MSAIDPTARVAPGARIGNDASIGPYCIVGEDVVVGEGCRLVAHVHVTGHTTVGARTIVYPFASLGTPPQSVKYRGGPTPLAIGAGCDIPGDVTLKTRTQNDPGGAENGGRWFFIARSPRAPCCKSGHGGSLPQKSLVG